MLCIRDPRCARLTGLFSDNGEIYEMFPFIVSGSVLSIYRLKDAYSNLLNSLYRQCKGAVLESN